MLFYADCANIELLHRMEALGILSGITTNPAILAREPAPPAEVIAGICRAFPGFPVFAQTNAETCSGIVKDAAACAAISPQVVVKIPACADGLRALRTIRMERLFDNEICITTVMTAAQAILASAAGAGYVAPYIGDIGQIGYNGMDMLRTIVAALKGTHTRVLAAAVERAQDLAAAAAIGADIATITPDAAFAALEKPYPITEWYLKLFREAAGR